MIELKIDDSKFLVPSNWNDLTLGQYIDILNVRDDKHLSDIDTFIKTVCIISNAPELETAINSLPFEDFGFVREAFSWMNTEPEVLKEQKEYFDIDGQRWTLKKDFGKLTTGEAISLELLFKDKKIDLKHHEIAFGVLFRKVKEDGSIEAFNPDNINLFIKEYSYKVNLLEAYSVISFFLFGEKNSSLKSSRVSFQEVKKNQEKKQIQKMNTRLKMKTKK